jgi:hypothetical protein
MELWVDHLNYVLWSPAHGGLENEEMYLELDSVHHWEPVKIHEHMGYDGQSAAPG